MQEIKDRIIHLLEEIVERANSINQQKSIHQEIEIDLVMEDIRLLYREFELLRREQPMKIEKTEAKPVSATPVQAQPDASEGISPVAGSPSEPEPEIEEPQTIADEQPEELPEEAPEPAPAPEPEVETVKEVIVETTPPATQKKPEPVKIKPEANNPKETPQNGNRSVVDLFSQDGTKSVGERLAGEDNSLYKRIIAQKEDRSIGTRLQMTPITSLKDAIGVNEKFLFINELFGGNIQVYNEAIARLNSFGDMHEAFDYLNELNDLLTWDESRSAQTIEKLANFVQRRYMER